MGVSFFDDWEEDLPLEEVDLLGDMIWQPREREKLGF